MVNRFFSHCLASGPAWQAVAKVHRDAYGVAGTLVALAIFLSGEAGSLDQVSVCVSNSARPGLAVSAPSLLRFVQARSTESLHAFTM